MRFRIIYLYLQKLNNSNTKYMDTSRAIVKVAGKSVKVGTDGPTGICKADKFLRGTTLKTIGYTHGDGRTCSNLPSGRGDETTCGHTCGDSYAPLGR